MNKKSMSKTLGLAVLAAVVVLTAGRVWAQPSQAPQGQSQAVQVSGPVPWVSNITGDTKSLQIKQSDSDWFEGVVNTPLGEGDQVFQDKGGRSEIFIDRGTWIRLDENSGIRFDSLKDNEVATVLTRGAAEVSNGSEVPLYLDVPGETIILDRGGRARVRVSDDGVTEIAAKRGRVRAHGPTGDVRIEAGQTLITDANGKILRLDRGVKNSRFDNWSDDRDSVLITSAAPPIDDMANVSEPVAANFARNGVWIDDPQYGRVWRPYVGNDWAPYRDGRWVFRPGWGWTWVSYEPWGWYPYHYGRWIYAGSSWAWAPVYVRHAHWAPALVFWVDGPDYIAWQPYPYGVAYGAYFGPSWYGYVHPYAITCVHYNDFHRGYYGRYNRPWNDDYRRGAEYRGYSPRPFNDRDMRGYRSPRPDGFTPNTRVPSNDRLYVNRGNGGANGRPERVSYGANDRQQLRNNGGRGGDTRPMPGDRATANRQTNDKRSGGNFNYGAGDRPRPGNMADRPTRNDANQNQPARNTDRPRPGNMSGNGNNTGSGYRGNTTTDRPTQQGRTHGDANINTRPRPDNGGNSGSGYRGNTNTRPQPGNGGNSGSGYRGDTNTNRPQPGNNSGSGRGNTNTRPQPGNSGSGDANTSRPQPGNGQPSQPAGNGSRANRSRPQPSRDTNNDSSGGGSGSSGGGNYQPPADSGSSGGSGSSSSGGSYQPPSNSGSSGGSSGGSYGGGYRSGGSSGGSSSGGYRPSPSGGGSSGGYSGGSRGGSSGSRSSRPRQN